MAKIPKFKKIQEEREFWATHDFADYVDDTTDVVRPKDKNVTRQKSWTVSVYLTHEEGIALAELAKSMGESKSTILRQALHKLMSESGSFSTSMHKTYAPGNNVGPLMERVAYIGVFLPTENPTRDVDLARMLKSVLQAALPGPQIERCRRWSGRSPSLDIGNQTDPVTRGGGAGPPGPGAAPAHRSASGRSGRP